MKRLFAGLAVIVLLQACASYSPAALTPIAVVAPSASVESLLVVSTREPSDRPGEVFSGRRSDGVRLMTIEVSIPPTHRVGHIEWPDGTASDPLHDFALVSMRDVDREAAPAWLVEENPDGRVVVFVHGFNTPFDRAVFLYAQLNFDARTGAAPVLFTWPSRGDIWSYVYDRESAAASRDALESTLRTIVDTPEVREVTILAHSMGAWLAMEALRQYAIRDGRVDPKILDVVLAAPDLDVDVFRQQFRALGQDRPALTILLSRDDVALRISRFLASGVGRVGAIDLSQQPYRDELAKLDRVTIIDMSRLRARGWMHHTTFATSPDVVRLLGSRLLFQSLSPGWPGLKGAVVYDLVTEAGGETDAVPTAGAPALTARPD